jgi:hypothetical protein
MMCEVLDVSKSGYYASIDRPPSERARRHERIKAAVAHVHARFHGIYDSFKIAHVLQEDDRQESACRNTVAAAMREMGLESRVTKCFTPTTIQADPTRPPAPNTLARDFTLQRLNAAGSSSKRFCSGLCAFRQCQERKARERGVGAAARSPKRGASTSSHTERRGVAY